MNIDYLELQNFRGVQSMKIDFARQLNVFYGVNGAGKSTILDAMALLLSWITNRVKTPNSSARNVSEIDIQNGTHYSRISLGGGYLQQNFYVRLLKSRRGMSPPNGEKTGFKLKDFLSSIQELLKKKHCNLPLFAYYPINRAVLDIPLRIRTKHEFSVFDAYDGSLTSAANFRTFFEWFRNREDIENENIIYQEEQEKKQVKDLQLESVRSAIYNFVPGFKELKIRRNSLRMEVTKNRKKLRVEQLSDGEKSLMAMVGDIARRLAIANPARKNPLEGEGIILIDEIDLHLHPAWQRTVISKLLETFPNIQFFISTHSPQVIGEVYADSNNQRVFELFEKSAAGIQYNIPNQTFGLDSNNVLGMMSLGQRITQNASVQKEIHEISKLIDKENFSKAKVEIAKLEEKLNGSIPQTLEASTLISMLSTK